MKNILSSIVGVLIGFLIGTAFYHHPAFHPKFKSGQCVKDSEETIQIVDKEGLSYIYQFAGRAYTPSKYELHVGYIDRFFTLTDCPEDSR